MGRSKHACVRLKRSSATGWRCGAQVKDKAARKAEEAGRQRRLDAAMEADRVAALCQYEVRPPGTKGSRVLGF